MLNIEKYKDEILERLRTSCGNYIVSLEKLVAEKTGQDYNGIYVKEVFDWLCEEVKEPPLTEKEHDYLKVVFKPFWQDIAYVKKDNDSDGEYLLIKFKKGRLIDEEAFSPYWLKGTFFKGMEVGETYTLEELGITYESRQEE